MIITSEDLLKIEEAVGYDCVACVGAAFYIGQLMIIVYAVHPVTGKQFIFQHSFTEKETKYALPLLIIDVIAQKAKAEFHDEFNK